MDGASEQPVHETDADSSTAVAVEDDSLNVGADEPGTTTKPDPSRELPGISPAPPTEAPGRKERALDIPGSLPAGILLLVVFALSVIGRVVSQAEGGGGSPAPAGCVNLIVGIGLLCGGPVFRAWGIATSALGLVILPLIMLSGLFGPTGPADYLGLTFNVGMLLLLSGVPGRGRVAWGTTVAIAGLISSLVGGALKPEPAPASATVDYESLRETLSGIGVPPHDPQEVRLPYRFGGLSLTVPDGLPEVELIETEPQTAEVPTIRYHGESGSSGVGLISLRLGPTDEYPLHASADAITKATREAAVNAGGSAEERTRSKTQLAGKPSIRFELVISEADGSRAYTRHQVVRSGDHAYIIYAYGPEETFPSSELASQLFKSVRLPAE